jgi:DNA-binding NarL/FixJ family response regulator
MRAFVQNAAAFGINQADIANQLNIDEKTLRKHFREHYALGNLPERLAIKTFPT